MQSEKSLQRKHVKWQRKLQECEIELIELKRFRENILQRISLLQNNSINNSNKVSIFEKMHRGILKQNLAEAKQDLKECEEEIKAFKSKVDEIKKKIDSIEQQIK